VHEAGAVAGDYVDLAPEIFRQRLVVEGTCPAPLTDADIREYLIALSDVAGMTVLAPPVTHRSERYGWAGWIHWETSGAHFYAWDMPRIFFSVDMYTCKEFDPIAVVAFTREHLAATEITFREF
jgi:S-adenosylmethionine decarboxylase